MTMKETLRCVEKAARHQRYSLVVELATNLIEAGNEWAVSGYMFRGFAFEEGGDGVSQDLEKAIRDYRNFTIGAPDAVSFQYLARALMKQGSDSYPVALKYLKEGFRIRKTPELILGFAEYFKTKKNPDYCKAKDYYLAAAMRGRFDGFFGYAEMSRALNQPGRAFLSDCIRIFVGPIFALLLMGKARHKF